jgi:hypothetical protein
MPEEAAFFGRSAAYGLLVAVVYWFVSYELVGSVLLLGFGIATGLVFVMAARSARRAPGPQAWEDPLAPDGPFGDEGGPIPTRSLAPLELGLGLTVMALTLAFGPWFALAGLVPVALGAGDWLSSARREWDLDQGRGGPAEDRRPPQARPRHDPTASGR